MQVKHIGKRNTYPIFPTETDGVYHELLPDGSIKVWNAKTLNTGCDTEIDTVLVDEGLIYCPFCDEMCNQDQFLIYGED